MQMEFWKNMSSKLTPALVGSKATTGIKNLLGKIKDLTMTITVATYTATSLIYGPIDAGVVLFSELTNNKSIKHNYIEEAKFLYAMREGKTSITEADIRSLYWELGVVNVVDEKGIPTKPKEEDVRWFYLMNWIEKNQQISFYQRTRGNLTGGMIYVDPIDTNLTDIIKLSAQDSTNAAENTIELKLQPQPYSTTE
ncbi:hypothetical protein H6503_06940 [Candidatus Woesearchaeota archaeon]|nr:hypothetical protein [Candidatus Woesearchaeota archaeon]